MLQYHDITARPGQFFFWLIQRFSHFHCKYPYASAARVLRTRSSVQTSVVWKGCPRAFARCWSRGSVTNADVASKAFTRNTTMRRSMQKYHTARCDDHDVISARTGPDATFNIAFSGAGGKKNSPHSRKILQSHLWHISAADVVYFTGSGTVFLIQSMPRNVTKNSSHCTEECYGLSPTLWPREHADLAERCKTVRTLIVDERATESSDRWRRDPRSNPIGQAGQPEVREKSWIEPKKEPDNFFCNTRMQNKVRIIINTR